MPSASTRYRPRNALMRSRHRSLGSRVDRIDVTFMFSNMRAPRCVAPLTSAMVVSIGLVWPSLGKKMPPTTSSTFSSGHFALISLGSSFCTSSPNVVAIEAPRLSSSSRAAEFVATEMLPLCEKAGRLTGLGFEDRHRGPACIARAWSGCGSRATGRRARRHARSCRRSVACAPAARRRAGRAWSDGRRSRQPTMPPPTMTITRARCGSPAMPRSYRCGSGRRPEFGLRPTFEGDRAAQAKLSSGLAISRL